MLRLLYVVEGSGIYLWLQRPDVREPLYYVLPWDEKTAKALQKAIEENAQSHGGGVIMQLPYERSWEWRNPVFHPTPQPDIEAARTERAALRRPSSARPLSRTQPSRGAHCHRRGAATRARDAT